MRRKGIIRKTDKFINVGIEVAVGKQGDFYVAYCPALELSSYGKDEDEARKNFETEIAIFLEETEERGTLEKILLKLGWCLKGLPEPRYVPPKKIDAPFPINSFQSFTENVAIPC
jgi:predicted RNase H-like HicB family nuclease